MHQTASEVIMVDMGQPKTLFKNLKNDQKPNQLTPWKNKNQRRAKTTFIQINHKLNG